MKVYQLLLTSAVILGLVGLGSAASVGLSLDKVEATPGDTVVLTISANSAGQAVNSLELDLLVIDPHGPNPANPTAVLPETANEWLGMWAGAETQQVKLIPSDDPHYDSIQGLRCGALEQYDPGPASGQALSLTFTIPDDGTYSKDDTITFRFRDDSGQGGWNYPLFYTVPGEEVQADSGPSVVLTIVPEPATIALLAFGGLAALRRRRRR